MFKKYLDKILNHYGYFKFEMPVGSKVSEAEIMQVMSDLGDTGTFPKMLRDMCAQDVRLYFNATSERDRNVVRGGHDRTLYLLSLISKSHARKQTRK